MTNTDFIERFEAFARSKPADEKYPFGDARACALAQFGYPGVIVPEEQGVPLDAYLAAIGEKWGDNTFGALADRLSALRGRGL